MNDVRLIYEKTGRMRFISHLDMNRFMTRMLRLSGLPLWYTEGFHPHPYLTFALPLSLGLESEYEVMDFRLTEAVDLPQALAALNRAFPPEIRGLRLDVPQQRPSAIRYADFRIRFLTPPAGFAEELRQFLLRPEIPVEKKNKKGAITVLDLAPHFKNAQVVPEGEDVCLLLRLPAGNAENWNPSLALSALQAGREAPLPGVRICRTRLLDEAGNEFR